MTGQVTVNFEMDNMNILELTNEELFKVLLCGEKPKNGYAIDDYIKEWNNRCDNGMKYEVKV